MANEEQEGAEGDQNGGQDHGDQGNETDDPGPIGLGTSIRGGDPQGTRKAALDPDDPGPVKLQDLIEGERPGPER